VKVNNNASVGRVLDRLYETGVTEVFVGVAAHPLQVYCIQHRVVHLDSTSVSLQGEYASAPKDPRAVQIACGDSKDQLPKLKQAAEVRLEPVARYGRRGPHREEAAPQQVRWRVVGQIVKALEASTAALKRKDKFMVATNEEDAERLPTETLLSTDKAQGLAVEPGFRLLKDRCSLPTAYLEAARAVDGPAVCPDHRLPRDPHP
jgi:hypothetical protein